MAVARKSQPLDAVRRERRESRALPRDFYERPVLEVARDLVGKLLVHELGPEPLVARIVEVEAYRGPEDRAAHSAGGRRTTRNEAMWGPAGHAYLFFVYGMHWQFNVVTGRVGEPQAVLVRAVEPVQGKERMARRRGVAPTRRELSNGPGKLCQALGLDARHYGLDLTRPPLYLLDAPKARVVRSKRIGIDYAGAWALRPWRFSEAGNPYVSKPPEGRLRRA